MGLRERSSFCKALHISYVVWMVCKTPTVVKGEAHDRVLSERNGKFTVDGTSRELTSEVLGLCAGPLENNQK